MLANKYSLHATVTLGIARVWLCLDRYYSSECESIVSMGVEEGECLQRVLQIECRMR